MHPEQSPHPISECFAEVVARLPGAIARLPYKQQRVVLGFYDEARSLPEMAERLELNIEEVRVLLREAVLALRHQICD